MTKNFFEEFTEEEKSVPKSIPMTKSEWRLVEAYHLYGTSRLKFEVPIQRMLRVIIQNHIKKERNFARNKNEWLKKLSELEQAADEGVKE